MRIVIALGGALLRRGEPLTAANQRHNVRIAAEALAPIARRHDVVVSHDNGPQVLAQERGWNMADGEHFRRVVPSPVPQRIFELSVIELPVSQGVIVICAGAAAFPSCAARTPA